MISEITEKKGRSGGNFVSFFAAFLFSKEERRAIITIGILGSIYLCKGRMHSVPQNGRKERESP